MKRILIPTDFTIASLNVIHSLVDKINEPFEIILFHPVYIPNSISDLLFTRRITQGYITEEYTEACEVLKNKYSSQISSMNTVFFYGSSSAAFNNFAEGNKIDMIAINEQHEYKETYKNSLSPMSFIRKAKYEVLSLSVEKSQAPKVTEQSTLSELLLTTY
jgi:hypothetical protein